MKQKRNYLFGSTILAGIVAVSAPAWAQAPQTDAEAANGASVEEIVVTGSRIRRDPVTSPTPLIQISGEQLLSTGQATVIDYLAQIPALSNSQVPSDNVGSVLNSGGLHVANLRALGSNRTLTLIDGRRQVGSAGGTLVVSTNTIPRLLIESTEIITGGASSVYGADAVGGVLNFQLKKDFEGIELDVYGSQLTRHGGNYAKRASLLVGKNFLDDRLNIYAFGEYEQLDGIESMDLDYIRTGNILLGVDADPTAPANGPVNDGMVDNLLFSGVQRLDRPRWGTTVIANAVAGSPLSNPLIGVTNCTSFVSSTCFSYVPGKTWWFPEGGDARLANFGTPVGSTGASRNYNIGGDGEPLGRFAQEDRVGSTDAQRYQTGLNFRVSNEITAYVEAKYIKEETYATAQPTFFDFYLSDSAYAANATNGNAAAPGSNQNQFLRVSDNAFLPAALKSAILANTVTNFSTPTLNGAGQPTTTIAAPWARHTMFAADRPQDNTRELQRYVVALKGDHGNVSFVKNFGWDLSYTYGKMENHNREIAVDTQRFTLAADAVVDSAGIVNGRPGEIVCRVQLLNAQNPAMTNAQTGAGGLRDWSTQAGQTAGTYGDLRAREEGRRAISECVPLNIFGQGRQSQASLDYTYAAINVLETNEQQNAVGSISGQLWDFWGAGPIGLALGAEYRRETTSAVGRSRDTGDRQLFLNTGPDFPEAEYQTTEGFAELAIPLFRDNFLGEYAELSGSYRYSDFDKFGSTEVYGFNLVYRPVSDFTIKSSWNNSVRVPTLFESFRPYTQTFNSITDPCATSSINAASLAADIRANRIANCTALAAAKGLAYDFAGTTADPTDDYVPIYTSNVAGVTGGNPFLKPEESESFTFSTAWTPSFIPNFSLVLDYYEIEISNVIAAVTAQTAANNCVNGPSLNASACDTIFRRVAAFNNPQTANERSEAFKIGAPAGDAVGGFIQGSINYAKRTVRGLDFTATYRVDTQDWFGINLGTINNSVRGSWLIEQKNFNNLDNPADYTEYAGLLQTGGSFPRVRFSNTLVWTPTDRLALTWITDVQTSQTIVKYRDFIANADNRPVDYLSTGTYIRHDFAARVDVTDNLALRMGVSNVFDKQPRDILGMTLYSNFDPYGRRANISLNYRY